MKPHNDRANLTSRHRLRGTDYSAPGFYFLTITTHSYQMLFGTVVDSQMLLSPAGSMLVGFFQGIGIQFPYVSLDTHIVMPNHIHLLLYLNLNNEEHPVSDVVRWLKGNSLTAYRRGVHELGWPPYQGKLWMPGFHDEILRSEIQLENVRRYISENPKRWDEDEFRSMKDEGGFRR